MPTTTRGRRFGAASVATGAVLLGIGSFASPVGANENPVPFSDNPSCAALGYASEFKIDDIDEVPAAGTYDVDTPNVETKGEIPAGFEIELADIVVVGGPPGTGRVTYNWTASVPDGDDLDAERDDVLIQAVLSKAGPGGLRWTYSPGVATDTAYTDRGSVSHISFCFDLPDEPTDTGTDATDYGTDSTDETTDSSDESSDSTDYTDSTDETTDSSDESSDSTDETTDSTDETTDSTDETTDSTDETTDSTDETTDSTDETTDSTDETTDSSDESSDSTDETTDSTDETTDSTDEATDGTDDVSATADGPTTDGPTSRPTQVGGSTVDPATQVQGAQTLPRTGAEDASLAIIGGLLVLAGGAVLAAGQLRGRLTA
jgi:LPXTG-motif cell wall-anchored protein